MIVVIGLGPMGYGIGTALRDSGYEVSGVDPDPDRLRAWTAGGAAGHPSPARVPWEQVSAVLVVVRTGEQVLDVVQSLRGHAGRVPLSVLVVTTLSVPAARHLGELDLPDGWRLFEAPVSGGERGAREGTLTVLVAGPDRTPAEEELLVAMSGAVFGFDRYGEPALAKLLNNTLGAYNARALAAVLGLAERHGLPPARLLEVVRVSSGGGWMADNFPVFPHDLLWKDVLLLRQDVAPLPVCDLGAEDDFGGAIDAARALLTGPHDEGAGVA